MDLTNLSNNDLLTRVEKLARTERKITHLVLWHLIEVEGRRLYLDLGYTSLFKYLTTHLNYSEDSAYRRIQAAKLLKKVPQVEQSLEDGSLNLTQMQQVQKCLTKELESGVNVSLEQTKSILAQIQNKSSFETQKILSVEFNQPIQTHETIKPQSDDSVRLEITLTDEQMRHLQNAKDLLSHVLPNPTWAELISYLAQTQIHKRLGKKAVLQGSIAMLNADTAEGNIGESEAKVEQRNKETIARKAIKISTKRVLLKKAHHCCEFLHPTLGRCNSKYQLQIDHRLPLALGGTNDESNLRVLCRLHNMAEARRLGVAQ
ncbi:HNH endonuclease [Bdellovibrio sp. HCB288]|uniref:HNH endonuclease n=1 Tax=Bdellovibrio sp. HCB288 TaxID=3394355 RepID=UPI0039B3FBD3